ncbi:hypothetical protein HH308_14725 [Gordonia sp. TBRC 11910]|uniref:Uncharacterized protein n=1 Tax=Gordonia asplenii TaxID=2725283 RepID=A0A848KVA0_9ACTN|nr:DUF6636 domain-containing protein [Gordonia asplenii]NMO02470.1 hypothetical protein [Gordonia asplenii]
MIAVILTVLTTLILCAVVTAPAQAAAPSPVFFHSPSGRYSCAILPEGNTWLRNYQAGCQGRTNVVTATENECLRKWGPDGMAMVLERDGAHAAWGRFQCQNQGVFVGGSTANGSGTGRVVKPVLPYGQSLTAGYVTCTMRTTGVTCRSNRTGHGFFISLQSHRAF